MGAPVTEFIIEQLIITGLEQLRNQPSKLDNIFERLNEGLLAKSLGKKIIDELKEYILKRNIRVIQSLHLIPDKLPCFSILMNGSTEESSRSYFDDFSSKEEIPTPPSVLLNLTTTAYNANSGLISIPDSVDLSSIYVGAIINDANGDSYDILGPIIDVAGQKGLYIVEDANFAIGDAVITDQLTTKSVGVYSIPIKDQIQIGIHAQENTNLTKYLYYVLIYLLSSRRIELENAGYHIHSFNASDFSREENLLPDNITSRYVNVAFTTFFEWKSDPWQALKTSQTKILVQQDLYPKDDDSFIGTTTD